MKIYLYDKDGYIITHLKGCIVDPLKVSGAYKSGEGFVYQGEGRVSNPRDQDWFKDTSASLEELCRKYETFIKEHSEILYKLS